MITKVIAYLEPGVDWDYLDVQQTSSTAATLDVWINYYQ